MDKLNLCLSSLKAVKDGHVSKTKVEAVAVAAMHVLKSKGTGEVANALVLHAISSSKEQRLAALYALHEAVQAEKRKIEEKNSKQRTETRGDLSFALEARLREVFGLFREAPQKDRDQVAKILQRWSDRYVFPVELCRQCAMQADCTIPTPPAPIAPTSAQPKQKSGEDRAMSLMGTSATRSSSGPGFPSSTGSAPPPVAIPIALPFKPSAEAAPPPPSTTSTSVSRPSGSGKPSAWGGFVKRDEPRRDDSRRDDTKRDDSKRDDSRRDRDGRRRSRSRPRSSHNGGEKRSRWDY